MNMKKKKPEIIWAVTNYGLTIYPTIATTRKQSILQYGDGFQERYANGSLRLEKFKLVKPKIAGSKIIKEIQGKFPSKALP